MFTPEMADEATGIAELERLCLVPQAGSYAGNLVQAAQAAGYPPAHSNSSHM